MSDEETLQTDNDFPNLEEQYGEELPETKEIKLEDLPDTPKAKVEWGYIIFWIIG